MSSTATDDRTTSARIRDAAIECIAELGTADATARRVAERAGVSPGSVIHHFESMEGLRRACDEFVAATIRESKTEAAAAGVAYDPMETIRKQRGGPPIARYIGQALRDRTPQVDELVDELVADAVVYMEQMVDGGLMKPTRDPHGRAVVLTLWSLGGIMLSEHFERLLGVDITRIPDDPATVGAYVGSVMEILHDGLMTDAAFDLMKDAFAAEEADTEGGREVGS